MGTGQSQQAAKLNGSAEVAASVGVQSERIRPAEQRVRLYLDEAAAESVAPGSECANFSTLARYTLDTVRTFILDTSGNVADESKIGADGAREAVTSSDKAVSGLLLKKAQVYFDKSWTEEHRPKNAKDLDHTDPLIIIDPIDGTLEFTKKLFGGFANLFAVLESRNGVHLPVAGMVVVPRPDTLEFKHCTGPTEAQKLKGSELWRTASPDGGLVYEVNGVAQEKPYVRSLDEIKASGEIRFHVRGVFAKKYNQEVNAGKHAGAAAMDPIEWTLGHEEDHAGVDFNVTHYQEVVAYAKRLAEGLGVKAKFVAAGGSGSGICELLSGRVDVLLTLPGDRAKEWDIVPAAPLLGERVSSDGMSGWVRQCNGQSFNVRGFNQADATLRDGYIASVAVPPETLLDRAYGLAELNTASKRAELKVVPGAAEVSKKIAELESVVTGAGQGHLLEQVRRLQNHQQQLKLLTEISEVNWTRFAEQRYALPNFTTAAVVAAPVQSVAQCRALDGLVRAGEIAYEQSKVGVVIVAGGSGTRLGATCPKGCVPAMPLSGNSIFQQQVDKVIGLQNRYGGKVPLYIMTSAATDRETRQFFSENKYFGLPADQVVFFEQGVAPTVDSNGKVMFAAPDKLLQHADGHGGVISAIGENDLVADMKDRGVEYLMYVQVDNLLAPIDDPERVGLMVNEGHEIVVKVLPLREPMEKQGRFVVVDGIAQIIEYTDVTATMAAQRDHDGRATFGWGSPSIYGLKVDFIQRLLAENKQLPYHPAAKKVTYYDPATQESTQGTGIKLETFFHDALLYTGDAVGLAIENRDSEFAAVKQRDGDDSIGGSLKLCSNEYRRWIADSGIHLDHGALVEISPQVAATQAQFREWYDRDEVAQQIFKAGVHAALYIARDGSITFRPTQKVF